jgi:S1-C subfamily serine protease
MQTLRRNLTRIVAQGALTLSLVGASVFGVNLSNDRDVATASAVLVERKQTVATTPLAATTGAALPDVASVAEVASPATVLVLNMGRSGAAQGVGTGFIIDPNGVIVTNNHVVSGAQTVKVQLPGTDGETYAATVMGADAQTDLVVLRIEATGLPALALGNSAELGVGDWVVAIGNALALDGGPTVTAGVISALGRDVEQAASGGYPGQAASSAIALYDLIQTDAAINEGNSGGPLVNLAGEVIGINTLGSTEAQGIGFAIAIDDARPIIEQLLANGKVARAYLGIQGESVTASLAAVLGLDETSGVRIARVVAGSPAAQAGLQADDLIVAIGDVAVAGQGDLQHALLGTYRAGETVEVTVVRDGAEQTLAVTLGTQAAS